MSIKVLTLWQFQATHDGHFVYYPDSVTGIFSWGRTTPLVSVSLDGESIPQVYAYADVLTASFGNATFEPSPLTEIDGQDATEPSQVRLIEKDVWLHRREQQPKHCPRAQ